MMDILERFYTAGIMKIIPPVRSDRKSGWQSAKKKSLTRIKKCRKIGQKGKKVNTVRMKSKKIWFMCIVKAPCKVF